MEKPQTSAQISLQGDQTQGQTEESIKRQRPEDGDDPEQPARKTSRTTTTPSYDGLFGFSTEPVASESLLPPLPGTYECSSEVTYSPTLRGYMVYRPGGLPILVPDTKILGLPPHRVGRRVSQSRQHDQGTQTGFDDSRFLNPSYNIPLKGNMKKKDSSRYIDRHGPFDPETAPFKGAKKHVRQHFPPGFFFPDDDDPIDSNNTDETETAGSRGDESLDGKGKEKAVGVSEDTAKDAAKNS